MVARKHNPAYMKNPLTLKESYVKIGSRTYLLVQQLLQKYKHRIAPARKEYLALTTRVKPAYLSLKQNAFCGEICGYKPRSFPVDTEKRCRAALSYARYADDPQCIRECALEKAKAHDWRCGVTSNKPATINSTTKTLTTKNKGTRA